MVAVLMSNRYEFVETMLAVFRAGGTAALINTRLTSTELMYPIFDSGAALIVTESSFLPRLETVLKGPDAPPLFSADPAPGWASLNDLRHAEADPVEVEAEPEDIALLAYTSGTTGEPKAAMLSHRAIVANASARAVADGLTWNDRVLCLMPLAFTGGCSTFLREVICTGATGVVESTFEPSRCSNCSSPNASRRAPRSPSCGSDCWSCLLLPRPTCRLCGPGLPAGQSCRWR